MSPKIAVFNFSHLLIIEKPPYGSSLRSNYCKLFELELSGFNWDAFNGKFAFALRTMFFNLGSKEPRGSAKVISGSSKYEHFLFDIDCKYSEF